jgi:glycopeptide antibiotics resistance protein
MAKKVLNIAFYVIAAFYAFIMMDLLFRFKTMFEAGRVISRSYNLIPFKTILEFMGENSLVSRSYAASNILGNIILFIPCGVYLRAMPKQGRFAKSLLMMILVTVAIESIQFAFGLGACDIDDVILNSVGGAIGIAGYALLGKALGEESRAKTAVSAVSLVLGVPVIFLYFTTVFNHLRL